VQWPYSWSDRRDPNIGFSQQHSLFPPFVTIRQAPVIRGSLSHQQGQIFAYLERGAGRRTIFSARFAASLPWNCNCSVRAKGRGGGIRRAKTALTQPHDWRHWYPPRVAVCGECAPTLWAQGKANAAVPVEHLWDEIARTQEVDILCGYVLNSFQREQESPIFERICAEHSAVS
jgi:hypothetical protein